MVSAKYLATFTPSKPSYGPPIHSTQPNRIMVV